MWLQSGFGNFLQGEKRGCPRLGILAFGYVVAQEALRFASLGLDLPGDKAIQVFPGDENSDLDI